MFQYRFGYAPSPVGREWVVHLKVSYTVSEYLPGYGVETKVYYAYVREKLINGGFTPGEAVNLELTANKGGRRFRKGVPYDLDTVNLFESFDVSAPTKVATKSPSAGKNNSLRRKKVK